MKNIILSLAFLFLYTTAMGQVASKEIKNSSKTTEITTFYDNGQVKEHGYFNALGKLEGHWILYDTSGNILVQGEYNNGMKEGKWLFWDSNALKEVDFKANKLLKYHLWTKAEYLAQK
jgi:antitoxin component YwqK of YwqJK toxin-antitoxin module